MLALYGNSEDSIVPVISSEPEPGIVTVSIDYPPVNALPAQGWFDLAEAVTRAGANPATRVVVLRAENRGFCAGVDI